MIEKTTTSEQSIASLDAFVREALSGASSSSGRMPLVQPLTVPMMRPQAPAPPAKASAPEESMRRSASTMLVRAQARPARSSAWVLAVMTLVVVASTGYAVMRARHERVRAAVTPPPTPVVVEAPAVAIPAPAPETKAEAKEAKPDEKPATERHRRKRHARRTPVAPADAEEATAKPAAEEPKAEEPKPASDAMLQDVTTIP